MLVKNFWDLYEVKHRRGRVGGEVISQIHCQEAQACSGTSCEWERNSCSPPLSMWKGGRRGVTFLEQMCRGGGSFQPSLLQTSLFFVCYSCRSVFLNLHFAYKGPTFIIQREPCEIVR